MRAAILYLLVVFAVSMYTGQNLDPADAVERRLSKVVMKIRNQKLNNMQKQLADVMLTNHINDNYQRFSRLVGEKLHLNEKTIRGISGSVKKLVDEGVQKGEDQSKRTKRPTKTKTTERPSTTTKTTERPSTTTKTTERPSTTTTPAEDESSDEKGDSSDKIHKYFDENCNAKAPCATKEYRLDYTYSKTTDAFYKLHNESETSWRATQICEAEGAVMMLPTAQDIKQLQIMLQRYPDLKDVVLTAPDSANDFEYESTTAQFGQCNSVSRSGDILLVECDEEHPFICKVDASEAPYDEGCDVFGRGYISEISTTGSCYKIPPITYMWDEAKAECEAEKAHLVVLNSETEHKVVWHLIKSTVSVEEHEYLLAGFRANEPNGDIAVLWDWRTIMNQTLDEAGYSEWKEGEPNNFWNLPEHCGSLYVINGKLNDYPCFRYKAPFMCEKERLNGYALRMS